MFGVFFSILVIMALLSSGSELVMRIRVTKMEPRDKIAWWRRGGDEVVAAYTELFPDSLLPRFRTFAFWLLIALVATILIAILRKSI